MPAVDKFLESDYASLFCLSLVYFGVGRVWRR